MNLPDVQNTEDSRDKHIKKVGIRELHVPVTLVGMDDEPMRTTANFSIYCSLNENVRGANMSRFAEIIHEVIEKNISLEIIRGVLEELKERLGSKDGYVKMRFKYFIKKDAPMSELVGYMDYDCILEGRLLGDVFSLYLTVQVPYTSLCPCSKELSLTGAHNQRSTADITVELKHFVYIEEIIYMIETLVSSPLYSVLKRVDEKFVTEQAYEKPRFVEDMARDIALALDDWLDRKIEDYVVVINHFESIHKHNAVAVINAGRMLK